MLSSITKGENSSNFVHISSGPPVSRDSTQPTSGPKYSWREIRLHRNKHTILFLTLLHKRHKTAISFALFALYYKYSKYKLTFREGDG